MRVNTLRVCDLVLIEALVDISILFRSVFNVNGRYVCRGPLDISCTYLPSVYAVLGRLLPTSGRVGLEMMERRGGCEPCPPFGVHASRSVIFCFSNHRHTYEGAAAGKLF